MNKQMLPCRQSDFEVILPVARGDRIISAYLGQYHSFWCPGFLRRQVISSYDIAYMK